MNTEYRLARLEAAVFPQGVPASEVECKPSPAPDFRVGDLVEVVEKFGGWFYVGERFFVHQIEGDDIIRRDRMRIAAEQVRLIFRL